MKNILKIAAFTAMVASVTIVPTASFAREKPAEQQIRAPRRYQTAPRIERRGVKPVAASPAPAPAPKPVAVAPAPKPAAPVVVAAPAPAPKPVVVAPAPVAPAPVVVAAVPAPAPRRSYGIFGRIGALVDDAIEIHEDIEHHNY